MMTNDAELATNMSYPTSASGIIVLLKTPKEIPQNRLQSLRKTRAHVTCISGQWYMSLYTIACQPIKIKDSQYTLASFK